MKTRYKVLISTDETEIEKALEEAFSEGYAAGYSAGFSAAQTATTKLYNQPADWNRISEVKCTDSVSTINL